MAQKWKAGKHGQRITSKLSQFLNENDQLQLFYVLNETFFDSSLLFDILNLKIWFW